jgi:MFS family permease
VHIELPRGLFVRDFKLLFTGQAVSLIGDGLFHVALAFAVYDLSDSPLALGVVFAAGAIPLVVFSLVAGVWADRLERRRVMLGADVARIAIQLVFATLIISGEAELWQFLVLQALYGTAQAFFGPASTGVLPQILPADRLQAANGLLGATRAATYVTGAAIGGVLVDHVGPGEVIGLDAISFTISATCLYLMHATPVSATERTSFAHELAEGFRELRRHRWLWLTLLNASLFLMLYVAPIEVIGPLVARDELGGGTAWGIIIGSFSLGMMFGGIGAATLKLRRPIVVASLLFLITGVTPLLFAIAAPVPLIALAMAIEGLAAGLFVAVWEGEMQRKVPNDKLSRVAAWDWMASLSGMPLGFVLGGVFAATVGIDTTLVGMAVCAVLLALWMLVSPDIRGIGARTISEEP